MSAEEVQQGQDGDCLGPSAARCQGEERSWRLSPTQGPQSNGAHVREPDTLWTARPRRAFRLVVKGQGCGAGRAICPDPMGRRDPLQAQTLPNPILCLSYFGWVS